MQFCTNCLGGTSQTGVIKCPLMSMNVHTPESAAMRLVHGSRPEIPLGTGPVA